LVAAFVLAFAGMVIVSAVSPWPEGDVLHFPLRHLGALFVASMVALLVARRPAGTLLRAAPVMYLLALLAVAAVFVPGLGVRAAGAHRWLKFGASSFAPAPFLVWATGLLTAAWAPTRGDPPEGRERPRSSRLHVGLLASIGLALFVFVWEPDFSAAGIMVVTVLVVLAGVGWGSLRLIAVALAGAALLTLVASRFPYVASRVAGFRAPAADRQGKGFEVLALERSSLQAEGRGLGHGNARWLLSSPASDYAFAVAREELGRGGALVMVGATLVGMMGAFFVGQGAAKKQKRLRAVAFGSGAAIGAPALLHVAVCSGLVPIVGVSWPLVSYDPGAVVAAGLSLGALASVAAESV
jgi:cell division protein FtsW